MSDLPSVSNTLQADAGRDFHHVKPLRMVLNQLSRLIERIDAEAYNTNPVTTYGGSIGGHVRHCLDHVQALIQGSHGGLIDYERRERGTEIETDPRAAHAQLLRYDLALAKMPQEIGGVAVVTSILLAPDGPAMRAPSCMAREIAFVLNHTIHHNAMIGGMTKALGGWVPADFGMAPGTLEHARSVVG